MPSSRGIASSQRFRFSLVLRWRQRRHRYAIRAGRNLPDKEFRYLRTVIVTAAVYRVFDQEASLALTPSITFRHRAGVTPYTSTFVFAECCVFNKQSQRPGYFDQPQLTSKSFTLAGAPSPEVTCHFCLVPSPEFSQAPWYSTRPPVSFGVRFLVT